MNRRRTKQIGVFLCLLAIAALSVWPVWKLLSPTPVSVALFEKTKALVEKNPRLKPAWDNAMRDGVLTPAEAKEIFELAGEKMEPEE